MVIAVGTHPISSRTRKLSLPAPMVLHGFPCGRVGRCQSYFCLYESRGFFNYFQQGLLVRFHSSRAGLVENVSEFIFKALHIWAYEQITERMLEDEPNHCACEISHSFEITLPAFHNVRSSSSYYTLVLSLNHNFSPAAISPNPHRAAAMIFTCLIISPPARRGTLKISLENRR